MHTPAISGSPNQSSRITPWPVLRAIPVRPLALALLALAAGTQAQARPAQQPPWSVDPVVGVWSPSVTLRDCNTGTVLAVVKGLTALHHGGTLSETTTSPPASRGPGVGTWQRQGDGYVSTFRFVRYLPDGSFAGITVIRRQFALNADGTQTGESLLELQNPAGAVVSTACASDVTTRLP